MMIVLPTWGWALAGLVAGAIAGSFLATLVLRWPEARSIADGCSRCDACGEALRPLELVPIGSYLLFRGRCRRCGSRIDPLHLAIEISAAAIGAIALGLAPGSTGVAGALLGWFLLALAALDAGHFWLPDLLTLPLLALGLSAGALGLDPPLAARLIGAGAGYAVLTFVAFGYASLRGRTGLGRGDAKLFAAIGAWLGWEALPYVLLLAATAGLGMAGMRLLRRQPVSRYDRLPLGALLAGAAWISWTAQAVADRVAVRIVQPSSLETISSAASSGDIVVVSMRMSGASGAS